MSRAATADAAGATIDPAELSKFRDLAESWWDPNGKLAPLHALTMGFMGATLMAMATRVTLGHSGHPLTADQPTWALFWLYHAIVLMRVGADLQPLQLASLSGRLSAGFSPQGYTFATRDLAFDTADESYTLSFTSNNTTAVNVTFSVGAVDTAEGLASAVSSINDAASKTGVTAKLNDTQDGIILENASGESKSSSSGTRIDA